MVVSSLSYHVCAGMSTVLACLCSLYVLTDVSMYFMSWVLANFKCLRVVNMATSQFRVQGDEYGYWVNH